MSDTEMNKTPVTIDDIEYILEDMAPEQQAAIRHIADIDAKIAKAKFDTEQLEFSKGAFVRALREHMDSAEDAPTEDTTEEVVAEKVMPNKKKGEA